MTKPKTPERDLALVAAKELRTKERKTARALLLAEAHAVQRLRRPVKHATDAVFASKTLGRDPIAQIRRETPALQGALRAEVGRSQLVARTAGRKRIEEDLVTGELLHAAPGTLVADDAFAEIVSQTLASAWGQAGLQLFSGGDVTITQAQLRELVAAVDKRLQRTAATEVARAFNDERQELAAVVYGAAGSRQGISSAGPGASKGAFKIWSAILDGRTCPRCFEADGETVEINRSFKSGVPPLHPFCRCVVEYIIVAKPDQLEDIAIDYDLFKQELRDVIREGRVVPERNARAFTQDSLSSGSSSRTLSRRFSEEAYATRRTGTPRRSPPAPPAPQAPPRQPPRPPPPPPGGSGGGPRDPRRPLTFQRELTRETVHELGAAFVGNVETVSRDLFKGRCPDADSWKRLWEPPPGYAIKFNKFEASGGELAVSGRLVDAMGKQVAKVDRTFRKEKGELAVHHDYLVVEKEHQGKGIGATMTRSSILGYREMGVGLIDVDAHWEGRYVWASFGFSWPKEDAEKWRGRLKEYLTRELGDEARAAVLSRAALAGAHDVATLRVDGEHLGKAFLLDASYVPFWSGAMRLRDGDVGYEFARKRLDF